MKIIKSKIFFPLGIAVLILLGITIFITGILHHMLYSHVQKEKSNNYYYFLKLAVHYIPGGNGFELGNHLLGLNPFQTQVLASDYIKDHKRVYYKDILIPNADTPTFQMIDDDFSQDKNTIYIHGIPFDGIDVGSFQKDTNFGSYVSDSDHIYYFDRTDIANERRNYSSISALPKNYTILSGDYGSVDGFLYYKGKKIENSYSEHFEVLTADSGTIIKTPDYINYLGYMVLGIDVQSFHVLDSSFYFRDNSALYFGFGEIPNDYGKTIGLYAKSIHEADKDTFEVVKAKEGHFAKDKNNTYERGEIVPNLEPLKDHDVDVMKGNIIPQ